MQKFLNFLTTTITFLLALLPQKEMVRVNVIENITNPQQVIYKDEDTVIIVSDEEIREYVISERTSSLVATRRPEEFIGLDSNGEIIRCVIEHYTISSFEEFSTKFTVKRDNSIEDENPKKELFFFETIRPIYLDGEKIIAVTAMDFLETHYYEIDIESGKMVEVNKTEIVEINKEEKKLCHLEIPKDIDIKETHFQNEDFCIVEDMFGNLYILKKETSPYTLRDYINHSLGTFTKK